MPDAGHKVNVSRAVQVIVTIAKYRLRTSVLEPNENKSLPIGTIAFVKEYLRKLGFETYLNGLKEKGEPLFPLVCAIVPYRLMGGYSTEKCGRWLSSPEVRNELGIGGEVSSRTLNRAIDIVGSRIDEVLMELRDSLFSLYETEHTDVNIDTTSVSVYSKQTSLFRFGYSRDKRPDLRQVNIGVAELRDPINIPIHMTVSSGNEADPTQFVRIVDGIVHDLNDGAMMVFDAGGDVKSVLDIISGKGMKYVTRKKMNVSDDVTISNLDRETWVCVNEADGVYCHSHTFTSSQRTVYLFFSEKLHRDKMDSLEDRARRCVHDARETIEMKRDGTLRISKTVIKRLRNPLISLSVSVQGKLFSDDTESFEFVKRELSNGREGFFKLECSENLTPSQVYEIYRRRDSVEKLVESLKNQIDLKPLRVWSDDAVKGTLLLCFLAQTIVSMVRYENPPIRKKSTKSIIDSLENLTATYVYDRKYAMRRIYSNFDPLNSLILGDMTVISGASGG